MKSTETKKKKEVENGQGAKVEVGRRVKEARKKEDMAKKSKYFIIYY